MAKRTTQRQPQPRSRAADQQRKQQPQGDRSSVATLDREPEQAAGTTPRTDNIARRAYQIYCERGCEHGRDMDDWLQAENELKGR